MTNLISYCERTAEGWTGEPLNTLSNLAFLVVAMQMWHQTAQKKHSGDLSTLSRHAIITLTASVGIGSALYHANPGQITLLLDILPILLLTGWLTAGLTGKLCEISKGTSVLAALVLIGCVLVMSVFRDVLNGSLFYVPVWVAISVLGLASLNTDYRRECLVLWVWFSLALIVRTFDNTWCGFWPIGTHFLWHCFAALSIWQATKMLDQSRGNRKQANG